MAKVVFGYPKRFEELNLQESEVREIVDIYFRGPDDHSIFIEVGNIHGDRRKITAGLHRFNSMTKCHWIELDPKAIRFFFDNGLSGGNRRSPDIRHTAASTLVHEIQHANQACDRARGKNVSRSGRYDERGSERDAKRAADEAWRELVVYLGSEASEGMEAAQEAG
jgi:hypothetical protein